MALLTVADAKYYIGGILEPTNVDFTAADFTSQSANWVEVDGWETMGNIGDAAATITTALINRGRDVKQKGTKNAGSTEMQFAALLGVTPDEGQEAMAAASRTKSNYAMRVVMADGTGADTGTQLLFAGLVMSDRYVGGGANSVVMRAFPVEINSNVVQVAAT